MASPSLQEWEEWLSSKWEETGALPQLSVEQRALLVNPSFRRVYALFLSLERAMQESDTGQVRSPDEPSLAELERGFASVMQQCQGQEEAVTFEPEEPSIDIALSEPSDSAPAGLSSPSPVGWRGMTMGYVGAVCGLFMVLVWNQLPVMNTDPLLPSWTGPALSKRPYVRSKGMGSVAMLPPMLRLYFGVSAKGATQPTRRGADGMRVQPGEWLYFLFQKKEVAGFLTLFERTSSGRLKRLYPMGAKSEFLAKRQTDWVLSSGGVALRYPVPDKKGRLGFVCVFSSAPLRASHLRQFRQMMLKDETRQGMRRRLANVLKLSPARIDAVSVRVFPSSVAPR
jgi:hypothetical protein